MRLFWLAIPKLLETAAGDCRSHFALAAGLSALIILDLATIVTMMQVHAHGVLAGGTRTLPWITVIGGLTIATLTTLRGGAAQDRDEHWHAGISGALSARLSHSG